MTRNTFRPGKTTFNCACCKRLTRDTGDNGQCEICPECYELGGLVNTLSDTGSLSDSYAEAARQAFRSLASHLGSMEAARATETALYDYVFPAAPQAAAPVDEPADTEEEGPGGYFVYVDGIEGDPDFVMIVDSTSSYQARRVAKRLVAKQRSIDGLTFRARKA